MAAVPLADLILQQAVERARQPSGPLLHQPVELISEHCFPFLLAPRPYYRAHQIPDRGGLTGKARLRFAFHAEAANHVQAAVGVVGLKHSTQVASDRGNVQLIELVAAEHRA